MIESLSTIILTEGSWVILGTILLKGVFDSYNRARDRADKLTDRELIRSEHRQIIAIGAARKDAIMAGLEEHNAKSQASFDAIGAKADLAYETSNGHNEKIVAAVELSQKVLAALDPPATKRRA